MHWLELTRLEPTHGSATIFVNLDRIRFMSRGRFGTIHGECTVLFSAQSEFEDGKIHVKETPEEILKLVKDLWTT